MVTLEECPDVVIFIERKLYDLFLCTVAKFLYVMTS